jgi:hypothetical protein
LTWGNFGGNPLDLREVKIRRNPRENKGLLGKARVNQRDTVFFG